MAKATLGERIRAARILRGITQAAAARRAGVSQGYLSSIECGEREPKKLSVLAAIIRAVATEEQQADLLHEATQIVLNS